MIKNDQQLGTPFVNYTDTKSGIEALSGVRVGATAVSTDNPTAPFGVYTLNGWHWYSTGSAGSSLAFQDEGFPLGIPGTVNFVGNTVSVSISGTVARVFVTGSSTPHNNLSGLQGGSLGEYYHLSQIQAESLTSGSSTNLHTHSYIPLDGWIAITDTWTRTGNHTFTVSGDVTATMRKGAKVRYRDGSSNEYGVIASSSYSNPTTTITLITNSNYAMAAATITDTYISYIENPEGFPDWFDWAPTFTGFSSDPPNGIYRWRAYGQTIKCFIRQPSTGTSNATTFTISAPVTAVTIASMQWGVAASVTDNGTFLTTPGVLRIASAGSVLDVYKDASLAAFTASGTKRVYSANIEYQF